MKFIALILLLGLSSLSLWASTNTPDYYGELFNERMSQRYPERQIENFDLLNETEIPDGLVKLEEDSLTRLLDFAQAYDLFSIGWSYEINPKVYQVNDATGEIVGYNFSIDLYKNNVYKSRQFYQGSIRVDGVFFTERISNYDIK